MRNATWDPTEKQALIKLCSHITEMGQAVREGAAAIERHLPLAIDKAHPDEVQHHAAIIASLSVVLLDNAQRLRERAAYLAFQVANTMPG